MNAAITDVRVNLLDELSKINDCVDVLAPCMYDEELWKIGESLWKLEAFILLLPKGVQDEVLNSSKYALDVSDLERWESDNKVPPSTTTH